MTKNATHLGCLISVFNNSRETSEGHADLGYHILHIIDLSKTEPSKEILSQYQIIPHLTIFVKTFLVLCRGIKREYVYSAVVYQKYLTRLGELIIFRVLARKLSFLSTELDIFDIRQHYVRILFIFQRLIC